MTAGGGPATPIPVDGGRAVALVNAYRSEHGLDPVVLDARLSAAAQAQALAMGRRDSLSHRAGGSLPSRVSRAGYDWGTTTENIGAGYPSLQAAQDGWERSPGHRKNLLNPKVTAMGIGAAATSSGARRPTYWAQIFAAPREEPDLALAPQ